MRVIRHILVALIAFALALVPTVAHARMQAMQQEMSAGAPVEACPCCDPVPDSAADVCTLKCCSAAAVLVEAQSFAGVRIVSTADTDAAALSPFGRQPDPPPPRS